MTTPSDCSAVSVSSPVPPAETRSETVLLPVPDLMAHHAAPNGRVDVRHSAAVLKGAAFIARWAAVHPVPQASGAAPGPDAPSPSGPE